MSNLHNDGKTAILLLAHGTPDKVEEIPEYLSYVTGGRPMPDTVIAEISHRYGLIGHSPLTEITLAQAQLLSESLAMPVYTGMRNWKPFIATTVAEMSAAGITRAVAICMAPQNSRTSVGLYRRATLAAAGAKIEISFVDEWHLHALLVAAFAERLQATRQMIEREAKLVGKTVPILFTAHSVPCRTVQGNEPDSYGNQTKETAAAVARACGIGDPDWVFAFQSQGVSGGPWIGPTVEETLTALSKLGHRHVLVQTIGFVCDHVEVLYDIDIAFRDFSRDLGMTLWRAESLNTSPQLIATLKEIALERLKNFHAESPMEGAAARVRS